MPHHAAVHSHWGVSLLETQFPLPWWGCLEPTKTSHWHGERSAFCSGLSHGVAL